MKNAHKIKTKKNPISTAEETSPTAYINAINDEELASKGYVIRGDVKVELKAGASNHKSREDFITECELRDAINESTADEEAISEGSPAH